MQPGTLDSDFRPLPFLSGGHRQTVVGQLIRRSFRWPFPVQDVVVDAGDDVRLLVRASWQDRPKDTTPAILLLHGLEGSDKSPYMLSFGVEAYRQGWHVLRMNMRGCGDSLSLCARLYNAGLSSDLLAVLKWLSKIVPRIGIAAVSLGANLTLLTMGREIDRLPPELEAAFAVSPPLDMSACADALELPRNFFYEHHFMRQLRRSYRERQRLEPDLYEPGRERGIDTLRAYDHEITATYGGYDGAEDYYSQSSAGPCLRVIDRPTLVLAARDDPLIPADSISGWPTSESVIVEMPRTGGHVGFVGSCRAPGWFYPAERMVSFFRQHFQQGSWQE